MEDKYDKNFKYLQKEIEEDAGKWKDLPCSWIGKINIAKMAILLKAIYRFKQIAISQKNSSQNSKNSTQFYMENPKTQDSQNNPVQ